MAWIRDGGAPDEIKVSFVVSKADHPELVEWLWALPFRKQSAVIRDVLSAAAKMVSSGAEPVRPAVAGKPANMETPNIPLPGPQAVGASSGTNMTEATAAILRKMQNEF